MPDPIFLSGDASLCRAWPITWQRQRPPRSNAGLNVPLSRAARARAVEIFQSLTRTQRLERLGAPIRIAQARWREFGHRGDLPEEIRIELEVREMALAYEMG